ncbi:alpha/beta-hydrolase [Auriscalpium vulgare]|uniref:Alpha/beta-hydrolase n=1 Tax=Auriscalpium vulgare TaxID=40419 RepID=A0ACB8S149_9AGAM|nr:alpha/beta-hydrolase [Auriscalpium vulgare]
MSNDLEDIEYTYPAKQVKAVNVDPIPQRIFDGMKQYEDAARGFDLLGGFEYAKEGLPAGIILSHRPPDAQVAQVYRMSSDPTSTDLELERLTYFNIGTGRTIANFCPIIGDDWRGIWRAGGAIMEMDLDGNEKFQLWRYWEDSESDQILPKIERELDNHPGVGRIERITNDDFRNRNIVVSPSNKLLAFSSNKENGRDTLIYITKLIDSNTGAAADAEPFSLPSQLVTPIPESGEATANWIAQSISVDDRYLLLIKSHSSSYREIYVVDISGRTPAPPRLVRLPNTTEKLEETVTSSISFSHDPSAPHMIYLNTDAYGDFRSVVEYDLHADTVVHITTPEPDLHALRPIPWDTIGLQVTKDSLVFRANVEGWFDLFVVPLSGSHKNQVIQVKLESWEGGGMTYQANARNGRPNEIALKLLSYKSSGFIAHLDITDALQNVQRDEQGRAFISARPAAYQQASVAAPQFRTLPPQLRKFRSFDGLEVPFMYYHPHDGKSAVPVVIYIHGGPEGQSTSQTRVPIHWYLLNELGCAVVYPNVRGSIGYGKRYLALDVVEKREDSVKDIGSLIDYIGNSMKNELDPSRIAVMGGSYGGYMVYTCLTHFSDRLTCGVANFGIAHWPSFLKNTADFRRDNRRRKYGDERIPEVYEFLERISPVNNAAKITVPLSIAHGETDSRVPIGEAKMMWGMVSKNVHAELMVCEKEGHGFKQKSVIEFTNAAKLLFLERFLLSRG